MTNPELKPGQMVSYYLEGQRTGHLDQIIGQLAWIRPIAPKGKTVRIVKVPLEDVKPA